MKRRPTNRAPRSPPPRREEIDISQPPLANLRVIDLGHALAGPFAATLLGDFGAEVIKVERLGEGDAMRELGPRSPTGPAWWKTLSRNKRSLALDWKQPAALPVLERLVRVSDVLIENFRPGVLERNGLGPEVLHRWNPDLVILRVSGYGQHGPYAGRPGFGKAGEAMSGLCDLTGFPDGPPTYPGFPMADATSGLMGAYSVMLALYAIRTGTAKGQVIDLALYETVLRLIDYHVPVRTGTGVRPTRNGNRQPMSFAISGTYRTSDGKWITQSAATLATVKRLLALLGGEQWACDPRFGTMEGVCRCEAEIDSRLSQWVGLRTAAEAIDQFRQAQVVAAYIYDIDDILRDPHVAVRENIVSVPGEACKVVNVVPKMSETPGAVRWLGPQDVGADSIDVLRDVIGYDGAAIDALIEGNIVGVGGQSALERSKEE